MGWLQALKAKIRFGQFGGQASPGTTSSAWSDWWYYGGTYPGSTYDYAAAVGRISENAAVQACVAWMQRACLEPPLQVVKEDRAGEENEVPRHPLRLLRCDNPRLLLRSRLRRKKRARVLSPDWRSPASASRLPSGCFSGTRCAMQRRARRTRRPGHRSLPRPSPLPWPRRLRRHRRKHPPLRVPTTRELPLRADRPSPFVLHREPRRLLGRKARRNSGRPHRLPGRLQERPVTSTRRCSRP